MAVLSGGMKKFRTRLAISRFHRTTGAGGWHLPRLVKHVMETN